MSVWDDGARVGESYISAVEQLAATEEAYAGVSEYFMYYSGECLPNLPSASATLIYW